MVIGRGRRREHPMDTSEGVKWPSVTTHVTGSDVTVRDVNHVSCQKYVLRMLNRKLRNIHHSVAFWPEVTSVTWPEEALSEIMFCAYPAFSRAFFLVVVTWLPDVTKGHLTPFGVPLGMRNRKLRNTQKKNVQLEIFKCTLRSTTQPRHYMKIKGAHNQDQF
jgi:hypothetical protein